MTIFKQEIRSQWKSTLIWTLSIGFMFILCIFMYPEMKGQMDEANNMFSSMGKFTQAFGMDKLNFGTLMGFYSVECGNILGIGGAFFSAIVAITVLMKEEKERTAEFLFTHPVSRANVVLSKLISTFAIVLVLNLLVLAVSAISFVIVGEEPEWGRLILLHVAYLLMQFEIAGICFGISAFLSKSGIGLGIGLAAFMYFMNIIANISDKATFLKHITPFGYTDAADIVLAGSLKWAYIIPGMILMVLGIMIGFLKYCKKDLR